MIAFSKLKIKYKSYESRRQLVAEYDIFLADNRIVNRLPQTLGKTFYRSTAKRPIPVQLTGKTTYHAQNRETGEGKLKRKRDKDAGGPDAVGQPIDVGADIQKALDSTVVHLSPSVSTSVRIAWSGWPVEWIAENIGATVEEITTKHVPKGWRGVRSLHIKSNNSIAIPVWLSSEMWTDDQDVLNQDAPFIEDGFNRPKQKDVVYRLKAENEKSEKRILAVKSEDDGEPKAKKRKSSDNQPVDEEALARKKAKKEKKERKEKEAAALKLKESTTRKEDLAMQKKAAKREAESKAKTFGTPKPKAEKKAEVSEVASKKSAIEPVSI